MTNTTNPAPSDLAAAIRAIPLPTIGEWGETRISGEGNFPHYSTNQMRAMLSAAAAIVEAAQAKQGAAEDILQIEREVSDAKAKWPPFNSAHEGYAVLAEEVDELWDHVKVNQKKRDLPAMYKEAKQVAAMALRFMRECCDEINGRK